MSRGAGRADGDGEAVGETNGSTDREELAAQVELLREENRRIRAEYARSRRSSYRRTALGLAVVGLLAGAGGWLFPGSRETLFVLAATGLFGAVFTYYLTPERFVAAAVGEAAARTHADGLAALAEDVGLSDERIYVRGADDRIRLFVPQRSAFTVPSDPSPGFLVSDDPAERGLVVDATGEALFGEFERTLDGPLGEDLPTAGDQLAAGLADGFELVDRATPEVDGRALRMGVTGSALGPVDGFDHPVASFVATGAARVLDEPVSVRVVSGDDRHDAVVVIEPVGERE
ncbi:hypothetical protein ACFQE8_08885 [Salinirubellus sp. GCM10025818]|uniref:hypothetical protein n=1 Tax=Salinirubellus TaxID=2162630 RepID=UPI0030CF09BF